MKTVLAAALAALILAGCTQPAATPASSPQPQASSAQIGPAQVQPQQSGRGHRAQENATTGAFDFYLLTLSWSPEYCVSHASAAECTAHPAFVLHGLWPENANGSYPQHCSTAPGPSNPGQYSDIFPDAGLLAHEWQTHGTCSGLAPDAYFTAARKAFHSVAIPTQISSLKAATQLPPQAILTDFAQANPSFPPNSFVLACGNNRLTAVEACADKNLNPIACGPIKSCRATVIKITPPGATSDQ